jgi:RNA polymerase sigma-70 factor (ECF subfamily)
MVSFVNADAAVFTVSSVCMSHTGAGTLQREHELGRFLAEVEKRALRIAEISIRDRDEAHDLVQNAMIKLARKYSDRGNDEWTPLFYRILQNGVRDWHRRQAVRNRVMVWTGRSKDEDGNYDPIAAAPDPGGRTPEEHLQNREAMQALELELSPLERLRAYLRATNLALQPKMVSFTRDFGRLSGARGMAEAHTRYIVEITRALLDEAVENDEVNSFDTGSLALVLGRLGREFSRPEVAGIPKSSARDTADSIAEIILNGLLAIRSSTPAPD